MKIPLLEDLLTHEVDFRGVCAKVENKPGFVLIKNKEILLPETNCILKVRLPRNNTSEFVEFAGSNHYSVLLDSESRPAGLAERLSEKGFVSQGKSYFVFLNPENLLRPPGEEPVFTPVGPSELGTFIKLVLKSGHGLPQSSDGATGLLWSFRARSLLVSSFLAVLGDRDVSAFAIFHKGPLARLIGPFPAGIKTEFVVSCSILNMAWQRAKVKRAEIIYTFAGKEEIKIFNNFGFRSLEDHWIEVFSRQGNPRGRSFRY